MIRVEGYFALRAYIFRLESDIVLSHMYLELYRHRHTDAHGCVPLATAPVVNKKADAQALLSKLFPDANPGARPSSSTTRARPLPTDPAKLAKLRAIELMKIKHKAVAADPSQAKGSGIRPMDKIHLRVVYAPSGGTKTEKVLWYLKVWGSNNTLSLLHKSWVVVF